MRADRSPLTPTHHAFLHASSTYLTHLRQRLSDVIADAAPQWHANLGALREIHNLSSLLCDIMCWVRKNEDSAHYSPSILTEPRGFLHEPLVY